MTDTSDTATETESEDDGATHESTPESEESLEEENGSSNDESNSTNTSNTGVETAEETEDEPTEPGDAAQSKFNFQKLPKSALPTGVQYTPEFEEGWVYPTGSRAGGGRDAAPVQGIELGVLATDDELVATVKAVLEALAAYHDSFDEYPRHRIIETIDAFRANASGEYGLVAVIQPSPDTYDSLADHLSDLQNGEASGNSNLQTARNIAQYLAIWLEYRGLGGSAHSANLPDVTGWEDANQLASFPILEHYGPLGSELLYNPHAGSLDMSQDGVESISALDFEPEKLDIDSRKDFFR